MAQIDFSNAVLTPVRATYMNPYMSFEPTTNVSMRICNSSGSEIGSITTRQRLVDETGKFVEIYIGNIGSGQSAGTEFYIAMGSSPPHSNFWQISNISFTGGDTFILQIKAEFA